MAKVVTLTLNPALDIAMHVANLVPSEKLRCTSVRRDPGGGGINVARAIHRLGGGTTAVYAYGGGSGDELRELLGKEGILHRGVHVAGHTRESFNVTEDRSGDQFRFILPGDIMSEDESRRCMDTALALTTSGDYLVCSGSLPPGVPMNFYAVVTHAARARGVLSAIDTHGPSLKAALDVGVDVVKTSAREMGDYLGGTPSDPDGWAAACRVLVDSGKAGLVAVTLGAQGAVMVTGSKAWHVTVPKVKSSTTVGAGDSFLGGLLVKLVENALPDDALRYAAAAGTAALLVHGTGLCDSATVDKLYADVRLREL